MRIKLTESQYEKLRLIKESEDMLEKYKKLCSDTIVEVDKMYLNVINTPTSDYLDMTINADDLERKLNKLEDVIYKAEKNILNMNQGDEDFESIVENLASSVTRKITSLNLILQIMSELQDKEEEYNLTKDFSNVKPMEIQSFE